MEAFERALTKFLERGKLLRENRQYREHLEEVLKRTRIIMERTRKLQATNLLFNKNSTKKSLEKKTEKQPWDSQK